MVVIGLRISSIHCICIGFGGLDFAISAPSTTVENGNSTPKERWRRPCHCRLLTARRRLPETAKRRIHIRLSSAAQAAMVTSCARASRQAVKMQQMGENRMGGLGDRKRRRSGTVGAGCSRVGTDIGRAYPQRYILARPLEWEFARFTGVSGSRLQGLGWDGASAERDRSFPASFVHFPPRRGTPPGPAAEEIKSGRFRKDSLLFVKYSTIVP